MYNNLQEMINTGQFGVDSPIQYNQYNPYMNQPQQQIYGNITQFNPYYAQQPLYNDTTYSPYQQYNNNGFVFQPINNNYDGYYQPPKYDYYNPYGAPINQYPNLYNGYNNYYNRTPYLSPMQRDKIISESSEIMKQKYRIFYNYTNKEGYSEDEIDNRIKSMYEVKPISQEEQEKINEYNHILTLNYYCDNSFNYETYYQKQAKILRLMSENFHKEFDNHSLCQFIHDDMWRLQQEEWIRKYIKSDMRNLSSTYNSSEYNELLNMHRNSNPYIGALLNTSQYDNNIDDFEVGMNTAYDKARRRQAILEGKVPSFISSEETQKRRAAWTNQIMQQIYNKGGSIQNV